MCAIVAMSPMADGARARRAGLFLKYFAFIGLLVSVPIVVFGSTMVLKLVERFPLVTQVGAAVLAFTAAKMIVDEPFLESVFEQDIARWATYAVAVVGVLAAGRWAAPRPSAGGEDGGEKPASHAA